MENHLILNIWYLWLHTGHWIPDWVITGCQQIIWLPPYTDFCTARLFCTCQFLHVCLLAHKTDIVLSHITLLSTVFYRFCPFSFMFAHLYLPQCIRKSSVLGLQGFPYLGWFSLEKGFLWVHHTTGICHIALGCTPPTNQWHNPKSFLEILVFSIFRCADNYYLLDSFYWVSIKWLSDIHQGSGSRISVEDQESE